MSLFGWSYKPNVFAEQLLGSVVYFGGKKTKTIKGTCASETGMVTRNSRCTDCLYRTETALQRFSEHIYSIYNTVHSKQHIQYSFQAAYMTVNTMNKHYCKSKTTASENKFLHSRREIHEWAFKKCECSLLYNSRGCIQYRCGTECNTGRNNVKKTAIRHY